MKMCVKYLKKSVVIYNNIIDKYIRIIRSYRVANNAFKCGSNLKVDTDCYFSELNNIELGDNIVINRGVIMPANRLAGIKIGNNCVFSYRCQILTGGRKILDEVGFSKEHEYKEVKIGNNVWVGANSIILPGVVIPDNVVIAAGSIVTKSLESGNIYGGVPARFLKKI